MKTTLFSACKLKHTYLKSLLILPLALTVKRIALVETEHPFSPYFITQTPVESKKQER
jgi:hypothetical protein